MKGNYTEGGFKSTLRNAQNGVFVAEGTDGTLWDQKGDQANEAWLWTGIKRTKTSKKKNILGLNQCWPLPENRKLVFVRLTRKKNPCRQKQRKKEIIGVGE